VSLPPTPPQSTPKPEEQSKKKDNKPKDLDPSSELPEALKKEAQKGLEWRKQYKRGGTQMALRRANEFIKNKTISSGTIRTMVAYFNRHLIDKKGKGFNPGEEGYPNNARIAWSLWGGDVGFIWARGKQKQLKKEENKGELEAHIMQALKDKSREHNLSIDNIPFKKVTTRLLTLVFKRGFKNQNTDEAYQRVNSFLNAVKHEKFTKETHDTDLIPKGHKLRK